MHMYNICVYIYLYILYPRMHTRTHTHSHKHAQLCMTIATPFKALQHTAAHSNRLQHAATRCNTLQHAATHLSTTIATLFQKLINLLSPLLERPSLRSPNHMIQCTATHCNTPMVEDGSEHDATTHCYILQHTATHCNTLQHTATHCNTLQHTATHYNTLQPTATHCHTLQRTATHCNTLHYKAWKSLTIKSDSCCQSSAFLVKTSVGRLLQHTADHYNTQPHTATHNRHFDTLQHTATHCNTLHHTVI